MSTRNGLSILALLLVVAHGVANAQSSPEDPTLRRGLELYRSGDCPQAIAVLSGHQASAATLAVGRCYLEMREYTKARVALLQYGRSAATDELGAILLSRAYAGEHDSRQAAAALEPLLRQNPQSLALRDALGDIYANDGQLAEAADLYRAVLKIWSSDSGALIGLGALAAKQENWAVAADQYGRVLAVAPENAAALAGAGTARMGLGDNAAALPLLERALRLRPDDWELTRALAGCYMKSRKWAELIEALQHNSLAHADDETVTDWMAQAFSHAGGPAAAEQYYRSLLQKAPGNFTARLLLGNLLYEAKRFQDAESEYVAILKARPDLAEINDRLGQIGEQAGKTAEARDYYAAASRSPQATSAMKMRLARLYFKSEDDANARTILDAILKAEPANTEARMLLAQVAFKDQQWDDVARLASDLLPGDPGNPLLLRMLGESALKRNRNAEGADYLEQALALRNNDHDLQLQLGILYTDDDSLSRLPRAFDLINEYVNGNPDDTQGYLMLANLYRRKSDYENADRYFQQGFRRMPAEVPPRLSWAYDSYGLLLFQQSKYDEALTYQSKAVDLKPGDDGYEYNLALTLLKLKRKDELKDARERLSQMGSPLLAQLDDLIQKSRVYGETGKGRR